MFILPRYQKTLPKVTTQCGGNTFKLTTNSLKNEEYINHLGGLSLLQVDHLISAMSKSISRNDRSSWKNKPQPKTKY